MNKNNNIENIFREVFQGYTEKPSAGSWNKIDNKIKVQRFNYKFKYAFNNFRINPSSNVWQRINSTLWLPRFLTFNISQFNIYYAALILLVAGSLSTTFYYNKKSEKAGLPLISQDISVSRMNKSIITKQSISETNLDYNMEVVENNDIPNSILYSQQNESIEDIETQIIDNHNAENVIVDFEEDRFSENFESISHEDKDLMGNSENSGDNYNYNRFGINRIKHGIKLNNIKLPYIPSIKSYLLPKVASLEPRDEIIPDTIAFDAYGEPIVFYNNSVSIEPYFGVSKAFSQYKALSEESATLTDAYQNGISSKMSYHYGLLVNLKLRNFNISSGLAFANINEVFTIETLERIIAEKPYYEFFDNQYTQYDTTLIIDLDAWLQGDTSYFEVIDTLSITFTDSIQLLSNDTVFNYVTNSYQNSATYFEVPFIFGYSFGGKRLNVNPSIGIVAGFLSGASGYYLNSLTGQTAEITALKPYSKILVSAQASVKLRYYFGDSFGLMLEPWCRHNLNSVYQDIVGVKKSDMRYGVNFGLTYRF